MLCVLLCCVLNLNLLTVPEMVAQREPSRERFDLENDSDTHWRPDRACHY